MDESVTFRVAELTDGQRRLLRLVAGGATMDELAVRRGESPRRTRREVQTLLVALGVRSTDEAVLLWWGSRAGARAELGLAAALIAATTPLPVAA